VHHIETAVGQQHCSRQRAVAVQQEAKDNGISRQKPTLPALAANNDNNQTTMTLVNNYPGK